MLKFADTVEHDAQQAVARAQRVAEREREHARADAERVLAERRAAQQHDNTLRLERAEARRQAEIRRAELAQRDGFVKTILQQARERFRNLPRDDDYKAWLRRLLTRGLAELGDVPARVAGCTQDQPLLAELTAGGKATPAAAPADIAGGLIISSADGRLTLDCSVEAVLARGGDDLREHILSRLNLDADADGAAAAARILAEP